MFSMRTMAICQDMEFSFSLANGHRFLLSKPLFFSAMGPSPTPATFLSKPIPSSNNYPLFFDDAFLHSSSRPSLLSPIHNTLHDNFMDSSSYYHQALKDYRYFLLDDPYTTQKMETTASSSSDHHKYSHFNFHNLTHKSKDEEEEAQGQHYFVMGADFIKSSEAASIPIGAKDEETTTTTLHAHMTNKQPFHHFFSPPKSNNDHLG